MKIKKDNGASLTGFVITILVILLIVAVAGCVYLINNPIKEKVAIQTPTNIENLNSSDKVETSKNNNEQEEIERKKRSRKRLFVLFLLIDIFLTGIIIYQVIELIVRLSNGI